jgi:hypothetical protein
MRHGRGDEGGGAQVVVADGVVNASACCLQQRHDGVEGFFGRLKRTDVRLAMESSKHGEQNALFKW